MRRWSAFLLSIVLLFSFPSTVPACNESQSNTYVEQILFGDNALSYGSDEQVKVLLDALYMCSIQSDGLGQEKLDFLERKKVKRIPALSTIDIKGNSLEECAHNCWEYEYMAGKEAQSYRRKLLLNSVNRVFDFGVFHNWFDRDSGKCNSFAALLYYSHILADYLADDPADTQIFFENYAVPAYIGKPYIELNGNRPSFTANQKKSTESFVSFSPLDSQGRCGVAFANIGKDIMPPGKSRSQIGSIEPSGWKQQEYPGIAGPGPSQLYHRSHLIAHQLAGEDGEENLITGTAYLNEVGMKPFEDKIKSVCKKDMHVLYRVTPVFINDNKVASGVQLEAYSVEDGGKGICFNVYCYNVQPGVRLNYVNGESEISDTTLAAPNIIPFAIPNVDESNPDLMWEMKKHLAVIFEDQKDSNTYKMMLNQIGQVETDARNVGSNGETSARRYLKLKEYKYEYFEVLKHYVPLLLEKEKFFTSVFTP